jgi:hypothetical protein
MASVSRRVRTGFAAVALTGTVGGGIWFATTAGAATVPSDPVVTDAPNGPRGRLAEVLAKKVADGTITQAQADAIAAAAPAGKGRGSDRGPKGADGRGPSGTAKAAPLDAAATALGMTADELRTALSGGKTVAAVAAEKSIPVDTVVKAMVAAHTSELAAAVAAGRLTQAQADQMIAGMTEKITAMVDGTARAGGPRGVMPKGRKGHGHDGGRPTSPATTPATAPATAPATTVG